MIKMETYDCIIVGAGISGLYSAREILKKHPKWSVALAERYEGVGGRTYSYRHDGIKWEAGAGRIHSSHKRTLELIKEYGLHLIPLDDSIFYKESGSSPVVENNFNTYYSMYIKPLEQLDPTILANHTILRILIKLYGDTFTNNLLSYFPYRSEVTTLRADLGLKSFREEMGSQKGYYIIKEGFSELIKCMKHDIQKRGCKILVHHRLKNLRKDHITRCVFDFQGKQTILSAKHVVLALHNDAISEIPVFRSFDVLKHLKSQPLLRIYGIFKKPWFSDLKRIVTPGHLRYIIPVGNAIMLSYTDGNDTRIYGAIKDDKKLEDIIMKDIRELFPERHIPDPVFFKTHYWPTGATYWLPGNYSPEELSEKSVHPLSDFPSVWLCGESWSMRQAWVEGALEHTELCLKKSRLG